jgi:hypothetical protein
MKNRKKTQQNPSKGFLVVASKTINFYRYAINLIESIKDYYPEAKTCLVTEERFCDGREKIADHLIYCGDDSREKLRALSKTPFDITMYIDADSYINHEDIRTAFDYIEDNDLIMIGLPQEANRFFTVRTWPGGEMKYTGGVFIYNFKRQIVKDFVKDWDYYYRSAKSKTWWPAYKDNKPDYDLHPADLSIWDQFSLWWLIEKNPKYKDLKIGSFKDEYRWNWYSSYDTSKIIRDLINPDKKTPIIYHWSAGIDKG